MNYNIKIAPLADYYVIAIKDKKSGELIETFTLNESGTDMLKLFVENKNATTVAKQIAEMYDVSLEQVSKDVTALAEKLHKKGLL